MEKYLEIVEVHGREILDSRGNPTVSATVTVKDRESGRCFQGMAAVPSGASTGQFEAVELRDGETRYFGLGVQHAVKNVDEKIASVLVGENALEQIRIDRILRETDGTDNKSNLGANAMLECPWRWQEQLRRHWAFPCIVTSEESLRDFCRYL